MLRREVIDYVSKNKHSVSFFEDDSIDTVRQQVAKSVDSHQDRLFILVGLRYPADYYTSDPRRWEALFDRLSYNGQPIEREVFQEYQIQYVFPNTSVPFYAYDKVEWMSKPEALRPLFEPVSAFLEYRILGVPEVSSYILPIHSYTSLTSRIPSARLPIPQNTKLFSTLYDHEKVDKFIVRVYDETAEPVLNAYFPLFRSTTPSRLSDESVRLLEKNATLLNGLLELETPEPEHVTIIRTRFYVPWVDTDFGGAIRTRFEQLFYGLTVSEDIPYIGFFTSKDQVTRHKFYVTDTHIKKPFLDTSIWSTWWSLTKPARNIPTLVLFRGTSKHNFDRIAITARDIVISTHRSDGNTDTIPELKKQTMKWLKSFDSIIPFVEESDLQDERWELQDVSFLAKYNKTLEDFDLLRFNCVSSIFDIGDKQRSQFSLLRTDHENDGISSVEVKLLTMMKEGQILRAKEVAEELSIPIGEAQIIIHKLEDRLEDDPKLGDRAFRGFPSMRIGPDFIIVSGVNNLEYPLKYANILRFILSNPESNALDTLCPKRVERVSVDSTIIPTDTIQVDAALEDEYADLFGYLEQDESIKSETESVAESTESIQRISTEQTQKTTYSYFKNRLQQFDPDTFNFPGSQYPKKCEQKHQPIILSSADVQRLKNTEYSPEKYSKEDQIVDLENPDGKLVCPEFWCMRDQIPLQESQLDHTGGVTRCPVCKGKLQTQSSDDPREFPVVKRETGFVFPGFVNYKSTKNGKNLPCCFRKSRAKKNDKVEEEIEDKYYILGETKTGIKPFRNAFLSTTLVASLGLNESYEILHGKTKRLANGMSGFFRVGLGRPAETLAQFLDLKTKIPSPKEAIDIVLKCSFLRTWNRPSGEHAEHIENELKKKDGFDDSLIRENLSRLISGIDEAFHKKELTLMEELEYAALALQCDIFRIHLESNTLGCMFYTPMVRPRTRGIVILQDDEDVDILTHVTRITRGFQYKTNVFESPFKQETYVQLEKLRNTSCSTDIPTYETALRVFPQIGDDDFSIVLDPYGRGQALYVPDKILLPFQPSLLPTVAQNKLSGYSEVTKLPSHKNVLLYLPIAAKTSKGYAWREDLYNDVGQLVEVLLESGLRIPVVPEEGKKVEPTEIIPSVQALGESKLTFAPQSEELKRKHDSISYSEEVYEFLLFQLTKDLATEYTELRTALQEVLPKQGDVEPLLHSWFNETTQFVNIEKPMEFLSKVRAPCGQFKSKNECTGNMCGWDGKVCRIQIREPTVKKERLFHRILSTLIENTKIRAIVLDGRTTPFFSTILYLELPNELIVTDSELSDIVNV